VQRKFAVLTVVCNVLAVGAGPASAHPHVWATMRTAVVANDQGLVRGVGIEWTFDETYTQFALEGLDLDKDGTYQPEELKPLTDENIKSLVESQYFTFVRQGGTPLAQGPVVDYGQTLTDGKLTLFFILPLQTPANPREGEIEIKVYDPDFFIAFDYDPKDPTRLDGQLMPGCASALKPLPTTEEMDQTLAYLADKGQDWKPEQPTDFGSMFAQALVVSCG
jgi:ABC-type uncharacterized transport system substrate-binding protein